MDHDALLEPLLKGGQQRARRPRTLIRTGRRGRLNALAAGSQTLVGSSSDFSIRHTTLLQDTGGEPLVALNSLLNTLQESGIPGPQLVRLQEEFSEPLGEGGQGNVRGLNLKSAKRYQGVQKSVRKSWAANSIAIKQHLERKGNRIHGTRFDKKNLSSRIRAAELEVLALAPGSFHNHPNIVKLVGWGLCLDTLENRESSCCDGVQLPLLIYERAEMNLSEFLEKIFDIFRDGRSDEVCMEEGLGVLSQKRGLLSLPGHIWRSLGSWIRTKPDVYGLIRLLCINVGHGLQSLHENNFTHGDLKPDNILIFRKGSGWTAKLCDFGCARGRDNEAYPTSDNTGNESGADLKRKQNRHKVTYLGTHGWLPSAQEISAIRGFDELRRCDLYVYGLLIWSSFCQQGEPHRGDPNLRDMLEDVEHISLSTTDQPKSPVCKQWIATQVEQVLKDTMKAPKQRSLEPWTLFSCGAMRRQGQEQSESIAQSPSRAAGEKTQESQHKRFQLSLEMKEAYHNRWWPGHDQLLWETSGHHGDNDESGNGNAKSGPASSVTMNSDDNCLGTSLFHTERRENDSKYLYSRMLLTLGNLKLDGDDRFYRQELYYLARFRSRVPIAWWQADNVNRHDMTQDKKNVLREVLQSFPSVDMHTLAWLCAGPIGSSEVVELSGQSSTWASVMKPDVLDESERLDRFLLLLQFGAPVATRMWTPRTLHLSVNVWYEYGDLDTIFMRFIESCRPAIVVAALNQIFERLKRADDEERISGETRTYFQRTRDNGVLKEILFLMDPGLTGVPSEATQLSAIYPLPYGWTAIKAKEDCYKEEFTQSFTLKEPQVSLLKLRQLDVGFLQGHGEDGTLCHVDLLGCMRVGSNSDTDSELAQDIEHRFPYYNEAWYMAEWNSQPVVVDILGSLKDGWRIRTFTSRLRAPEINVRKAIKAFGISFIGRILKFVSWLGALLIPTPETAMKAVGFILIGMLAFVVIVASDYNLAMMLFMGSLLATGLSLMSRVCM